MNKQMLEQVELLLEACDAHRIQPNLELEEARLFLKEYQEAPKGKKAELARVRVRVFELGTELLAVTREAERQSWTQEEKDAWAAQAAEEMNVELKRRIAELGVPRDFGISWARVIEKRRGEGGP